jgi:hypothetical protein
MRSRQIRFTIRHLMIGVAFIGFLIWSEQTRRRWAKYHGNHLFFCAHETETLELLNGPYNRIQAYCGMANPPETRSDSQWKEAEAQWRSGLIEELEHFRARKSKYGQAMWRPWLPIEPDEYTAK